MRGTERRIRHAAAALLAIAALLCAPRGAPAGDIADYLAVPGPLAFNGASYNLAWSSHPSPFYYKQEYLPAGQTSENYRQMLLLEAVTKGADVDATARAKAASLNQRKESDPAVNFAMSRNAKTGEIILDFIVSRDIDKDAAVVEWNAYRYAPLPGKDGSSGVQLFGFSRRAYGDAATAFLRGLKAMRPADIDALAQHKLPVVQPSR